MDPSVPQAPYAPPSPPAPPAPAKNGWPTAALAAVIGLAVVALLGVVGGQLMAKGARDDADEAKARLAKIEDNSDADLDELTSQVDQLTADNETLTEQAGTAASDLAAAEKTVGEQAAQIAELQAQLENPDTTIGSSLGELFPVALDDVAKVDLSAAAVVLTTQLGECTYATETCDYLGRAVLDADLYQDGGKWILTMRADGVPYFQTALELDATGSFSGTEQVNAEGTCNGAPSKPTATVYINPTEFAIENGQVQGTAFRGYLTDATDCGRSTFSFQGRAG